MKIRLLATIGITLGALTLSSRADITTGLVGHWTLDEGSGSLVADSTTNANNGTLTDFADTTFTGMWTTGWFNNALLFNQNGETTNYVSIPDSASLDTIPSNKKYTLAAWVKLSEDVTNQNNARIISKGYDGKDSYILFVYQNHFRIRNRIKDGSTTIAVSSKTRPVVGVWYHVVGTWANNDTPNLNIYVNGVKEAGKDTTRTTVYTNYTHALTIGNDEGSATSGYNHPFQGTIDDVRVYNRSLPASDVAELYTNGAPGTAHLPVITEQPRDVTCYTNDTATFWVSVVTTNSYVPVSYQWQFNGADIDGATGRILSVPNATSDNEGSYTMIISNYAGSVTSAPAMLALQPLPPADTTSGLVGWWKFDEANGSDTAADSSGSGNAGMLTNYVEGTFTNTWGDGINGAALSFNGDGSGSNVVVVPSLGGTAPAVLDFSASPVFTLSAWVKASLPQPTASSAIITKGTGNGGEQYCLDLYNGNYRFFVRDADGSTYGITSTTPVNGYWQHVVAVLDGNNRAMNLYVNGALVGSWMAPTALLANTHEVSIGNRQSDAADYNFPLTGTIDEVRVYNRALTSADVLALYGQDAYPIITAQYPVTYTNQFTLYAGSSPTLRLASVTGLGLSYQWYTNGVADPDATNASYQLSNLPVGDFTNYYCIVTNFKGSATSMVWSASVVPAPTAPYAQSVLDLNPIGYWRLNEPDNNLGDGNPGAVLHDYICGNDGLYTNVLLGQDGYAQGLAYQYFYNPPSDPETSALVGYAVQDSYAGQIQGIDFTAPNGTTTNFSVAVWVNGASSQINGANIVSKGIYSLNDAWSLSVDTTSSHKYRFYVRSASGSVVTATSGVAADIGVWHYLVGVLDETDGLVKLYIDGTNAAQASIATTAGASRATGYPMQIGSAQSGSLSSAYTKQFTGYVNDVSVYNYALSDAQVQSSYLAAGFPPSITQAPVSSTNINAGTTLIIPAEGGGGTPPVSVQWYDTTYGTPGTPLPDQTNTTLVIDNISGDLTGHTLTLVISNTYGQPSASVYLTVNSGAPWVTVNPSSVTVYTGEPTVFTATGSGTEPFSYQWSVNGTQVAGATSSSYTNIAGIGSSTITCTVTGPGGSGSGSATQTGLAQPSDSYAAGVLADHPVAYWRFDEPLYSYTAYDYAGGHNATYNNVTNGLPGFGPSNTNTAAGFGMNGITYYSMAVEQNNSLAGIPPIDFSTQGTNAEFSLEAWVKAPYGQPSGAGIVTKGYGHGEEFNLDVYGQEFRFRMRDAGGASHGPNATFPVDGLWHHVVGVCDEANGTLNLYVDGMLNATNSIPVGAGLQISDPMPDGSQVMTSIGSRMTDVNDTMYTSQLSNSVVDEVAIYDYALSADQVLAHYTAAAMPPQFVQDLQPQMYAYAGFPMSLTVQAYSTIPITGYQWQRYGTNLIDGGDVSGSQTNVLSLGIANFSDSGSTYQVFATNQATSIPAASTVATLNVLPDLEFNGYGNIWSANGTPSTVPRYIAPNVLQLTDGGSSEAASSFFNYPVYVGAFQAAFTYQDVSTGGADGAAFVIQNDARGAAALGGGGGGLGYLGITNSAAVQLHIYKSSGFAFQTNGATGPYSDTSPIDLRSGDPIDVTVLYANGVISMTLTDAFTTASLTVSTNLDLPGAVGTNIAFVGFTGAAGGTPSTQVISNFTFVSLPVLTIQPAADNQLSLTWPEAVGPYVLQQSSSLAPASWTDVTAPVTNPGGYNQVLLPMSDSSSFYRLRSGQ